MRKLLFLFVLLLTGCGLMATPTPTRTPRPTATPTEAPRYYPTVEPDLRDHLLKQLPKDSFPHRYYDSPDGNYFIARMVSTGKMETMQTGGWTLDVLWVYERNTSVVLYPLMLGVYDGQRYTPYMLDYDGSSLEGRFRDRDEYLEYLKDNNFLERGRKIFALVQGDFVSRTGIDWEKCGDSTFCQLGKFMQDTYGLDESVTSGIVGINYPIPEGWVLAWQSVPSTKPRLSPDEPRQLSDKIDLPGGEP